MSSRSRICLFRTPVCFRRTIIADDGCDETRTCNDIENRITIARNFLQNKPKNSRAMAKLACLLSSNEKLLNWDNVSNTSRVTSEAMEWAEKSISTAPTKPYGYTAMSIIHPDFGRRIEALRMAIQQCSAIKEGQCRLAMIDLLVRLLTEQRSEKARKEPSNTNQVTNEERETIQQIDVAFDVVWNDPTIAGNAESIKFLGLREYRLGRFFRKLEPSNIFRVRSKFYFDQAIKHLHNNTGHTTDRTMAQFWLATLSTTLENHTDPKSSIIFTKCPAEYVVGLYSTFASRFDSLLVGKLEYQTPSMLRLLHDQSVSEPWNHSVERRYRAVADLGCGTGLSGLAFASLLLNDGEMNGEMTGIDLSQEMLSFAAKTNCYNKLVAGDITIILKETATWDLVIACDVFCYIGDLSIVFQMVHTTLLNDGIFVFSTEKASDNCTAPFHLHECARFAHRKEYIESLAETTGFQMLATKFCPIRKNRGHDVMGILAILKKICL